MNAVLAVLSAVQSKSAQSAWLACPAALITLFLMVFVPGTASLV